MGTPDYGARLAAVLKHWPDMDVLPHGYGGVEFRVGKREIGHVHVSGVADLLVTVRMRRDLVAAGRAQAHHTLPHSGWISFRLRSENDIPAVVELFRLNYERLRGAGQRTTPTPMLGQPQLLADRVADDLPA
ncbi:MAG: luciferase family protein [Gemmatimonas sp.]|jgi:hypothetical protein